LPDLYTKEKLITIMRTLVSRAALTLLVGVTTGQAIHGAQHCTNADLKGVYGMLARGAIANAPPPIPTGAFVRVGRVEADGNGNIAIANTASFNGAIVSESYPATYTVNPDCSVDIKPLVPLPIGPGGANVPVPFEFVGAIADNGNDVAVVVCGIGAPCNAGLPPGAVFAIRLTRLDNHRPRCTARDLSGAFQLDMSGSVVSGPSGRVVFDGRGAFSGHATANYSGFAVFTEDIKGTYAVDSLCNVAINFGTSPAHKWTGTLTDKGDGANLIVAETGAVIAGTLKKQASGDDDHE
jgi:hypothetical protein